MKTASLPLLFCCLVVMPLAAESLPDAGQVESQKATDRSQQTRSDFRETGPEGETLLHRMAFAGNEAVVRQLIASGAQVNARVRKGSTPLHLAAYNGHTRVAKLLIEHGAAVNARTNAGITPLDWARRNGHAQMVKLLLAKGAQPPSRTPTSTATAAPQPKGSRDEPMAVSRPGPRMDRSRSAEILQMTPTTSGGSAAGIKRVDEPARTQAFRIQLGAFSSEQRALKALSGFRDRHVDVLGVRELFLDPIDWNGKVLYRVQAGPLSRQDAKALCEQLQQTGQACILIKPTSS